MAKDSPSHNTTMRQYYFKSFNDFVEFRVNLKFVPCPHCHKIGSLIQHGFLRGYAESSSHRIIRGRRYFCSNRNRMRGCGRTFSVLLSYILKFSILRAPSLWRFLQGVLQGQSKQHAFESLNLPFALSTCYRLWKRFLKSIPHIRHCLLRLSPIPNTCHSKSFAVTLAHLQFAFPKEPSPIAHFQVHFQKPFLV